MITHHAAAILMSEEAVIHDPEIKELTRNIISTQKPEIEQLRSKLNELEKINNNNKIIKLMAHEKNKSLLEALNNCAAECNHCATACLEEDDVKMLARCIRLDIDCADVCQLTASLIARGSEHGNHLLKECAEICDACAEECEKHAKHMKHCKACAEECRKCAEECRAIAGEHV